MAQKDITSILKYYGTNLDGSAKLFKDSTDKSSTRQVSLYTICRSVIKARILGELNIGESYEEYGGRTFTRIS